MVVTKPDQPKGEVTDVKKVDSAVEAEQQAGGGFPGGPIINPAPTAPMSSLSGGPMGPMGSVAGSGFGSASGAAANSN